METFMLHEPVELTRLQLAFLGRKFWSYTFLTEFTNKLNAETGEDGSVPIDAMMGLVHLGYFELGVGATRMSRRGQELAETYGLLIWNVCKKEFQGYDHIQPDLYILGANIMAKDDWLSDL